MESKSDVPHDNRSDYAPGAISALDERLQLVSYWGGPIPLVRPNGASLRRSLTTVATIIATPNANATRLTINPAVFPDLRDAAAPAPPRNSGSQPAVMRLNAYGLGGTGVDSRPK